MTTPLDIVRRTPKSNCGQCGYPTCLAYGAAVVTGSASLDLCPYLSREGLDTPRESAGLEAELIRNLKEKLTGLDLEAIAPSLGMRQVPGKGFAFRYLGQEVRLDQGALFIEGNEPEDPRDQILLYNYIHSGGGPAPSGTWIGLESLPNSISKVKTLELYSERPLARLLAEKGVVPFRKLLSRLDGTVEDHPSADLAARIPVLPRVPQLVLFWKAEPDEGFDAQVKLLFDANVLDFLDLESLVFAAERLADRCSALW